MKRSARVPVGSIVIRCFEYDRMFAFWQGALGYEIVERLVALGARRYPWRYGPHPDYVVLEDPGGNLFCVVEVSRE